MSRIVIFGAGAVLSSRVLARLLEQAGHEVVTGPAPRGLLYELEPGYLVDRLVLTETAVAPGPRQYDRPYLKRKKGRS